MSEIPSDLRYTRTHEWVRINEDGLVTVGITHYAQDMLGDIVHVDLPEDGNELNAGEETAVIESVKTAADIYSPISGSVAAINEAILDNPDLINSDPYGEGWLFQIQPFDDSDLKELLDAEAYAEVIESEAH